MRPSQFSVITNALLHQTIAPERDHRGSEYPRGSESYIYTDFAQLVALFIGSQSYFCLVTYLACAKKINVIIE